MKRGGTVLALVLLLLLGTGATVAAQDVTGPDVSLKERGDEISVGEDLISADGVGQQRSLIIEDRLVLIVKIQNDDTSPLNVVVRGAPSAPGFEVRYLSHGQDVTDRVAAEDVSSDHELFSQRIAPGRSRELRVIITVAKSAPLGAVQEIGVSAVVAGAVDTARAKVTNVS